jgi:hypothetical protein
MRIHLTFLLIIGISLISLGQTNSELIKTLKKELPESSTKDGRWVFNESESEIHKIEKPLISEFFPDVALYKVMLTNYLGYHVNKSNCLILFNRQKSKIQLVEPIWYSDIDKKFLKKFIGLEFKDKKTLNEFCYELQDLMLIGSNYEINNTKITESNITFDLTYEGRLKREVWRNLEIKINGLEINGFLSTNPRMNETTKVE